MRLTIRGNRTRSKEKGVVHDTRALSEVLGALMILAILLSTTTLYYSRQLPELTKEYESLHVAEVADNFAELDSLIDNIILVAKQPGVNKTAGGTRLIKMAPDKVPIIGMAPPGSTLTFKPSAEELFMIQSYVGEPPNASLPVYNFTIEETTTADFSQENVSIAPGVNSSALLVWMDNTFDELKLARMTIHGDLILNNTVTTLSGEYMYNTVSITNNSIVYLIPGYYLKLYANSLYIDATSKIIADDRGYLGGDGGKIGSGPGCGKLAYNRSGGGGGGYGGAGGNGGLGESAFSGDNGTGGSPYGDNTSLTFDLGSGGGGGGYGLGGPGAPHEGAAGGDGGNGGGAVLLGAPQIRIAGTISANSLPGMDGSRASAAGAGGGGGGGSGGTITIIGYEVNLSSATLSAQGGRGGDGGTCQGGQCLAGGGGGGGAGGRIKIFFENTSLYRAPSYSVANGTGGNSGGGTAIGGYSGSNGTYYPNQTTYISTVPHYTSGYYVSRVYNTSNSTTCYGNITWDADTDPYTSLVIKVRTSRSPDMAGAALWENCPAVANGQDISELSSAFDGHKYIQWRADFFTYDPARTPVLRSLQLNYSSGPLDASGYGIVNSASGMISFQSSYLYYPNQALAYEHGAVIQVQNVGGEQMGFVLHPPPIKFSANPSGTPAVEIAMINLIGSNYTYSSPKTASIETTYEDYDHLAGTISFDNLSLHFNTENYPIWANWFNTTLRASGLTTPEDYKVLVNDSARTVVVELYGQTQGVDLTLDETTVNVVVQR